VEFYVRRLKMKDVISVLYVWLKICCELFVERLQVVFCFFTCDQLSIFS